MTLTLSDLWEKCDQCDGTGTRKRSVEPGGSVSVTPGDCDSCSGRGGYPTPSGQAVLDLIEKAKRPAQP